MPLEMFLSHCFLVILAGHVTVTIAKVQCPETKSEPDTCARIEHFLFPPTFPSCPVCTSCGDATRSSDVCDQCSKNYLDDCPFHGPLLIIEDKQLPLDGSDPERALKSVPASVYVTESPIPGAGLGVFARQPIFKRTRFGPYEGVVGPDFVGWYAWELLVPNEIALAVDGEDPALSNWLRYVNAANTEDEQNLVAFQYKGQIFYRAYKDIAPGTELLVWYGKEYGVYLGIIPEE